MWRKNFATIEIERKRERERKGWKKSISTKHHQIYVNTQFQAINYNQDTHTRYLQILSTSSKVFRAILLSFHFIYFLPKCLSINYRYCCCHSSPISISIYSHSLSRFMLLQYKKLLLISNGVSIKRGARSQQGK